MYRVFNMGIGFCVIVPVDTSVKRVFLPQHDLVGEGDTFTTL